MLESFYMSNIAPQAPAFNRGIWQFLEDKVRVWTGQYGQVYVVTGPVLESSLPTIGVNGVLIPAYFYKIVLTYPDKSPKLIAFLLPNREAYSPLSAFVCSVDDLEQITGIDFFPGLPNAIEDRLESTKRPEGWGLE
jgi:endonuclease G